MKPGTATTIWIGNIHLGDMQVPVKLHSAVRENNIAFHLLHKKDRVRLRQQMICAYEKAPVPGDEQVKGFQVDERKYILIGPEELAEAEPDDSRDIEVHEFASHGEIDPVFIERSYYLEPGEAAERYMALAAALKETNAEGICTWVMRKRAYFGALQSTGNALRLNTLRHSDEVIQPQSLGLEDFTLSDKELEIGSELIDKLTVKFEPQKYRNEHRIKLQALIDKKARGEKIYLLKPKHLKPTEPGKLLAALEKSMKQAA